MLCYAEIHMNVYEVVGFVMDTVGKLMVAYTSLMVHHRFTHEHKIDELVFRAMRREQYYGFIGIAMIIVGSSLEIAAKLGVL